ncbi:hypothetical protein SLE2022_336070 [Rubroshorea leprosula]
MESSKCVSFLRLLLLLLLPSSYSISFQIPNFTPSPNYILYQGDAVSSSGTVELTSNVEAFRVGGVTYANEVLMNFCFLQLEPFLALQLDCTLLSS